MDRPLLQYWSFVTALIGGILILVGGVFMALMMAMMGSTMWWMMGSPPAPGPWGWTGMMAFLLLWSVITGVLVLVGAVQVRSAKSPLAWGVALVVLGALSLPAMGGFFVGAIAAIASGVMAIIAASPETKPTPPASPPGG